MDNNNLELLQAIRGIVREEVSEQVDKLRVEVAEMDNRVTEMDNRLTEMDNRLTGQIAELTSQISALTRQNNETCVLVENNYNRILKLLQEDYSRVAHGAARGTEAMEHHKELKNTVQDHEHVLHNHHKRITDLENKAM